MQDMMHGLSPSLLERQRAHLYWQHQQQQQQQVVSLENLLTEGGWPNLSTPHQYPINTREEVTTPSPTTTTTSSITATSAPQVGKCPKKRKADKPPMVGSDDDEKRMKGDQWEKQRGDGSEDSGSNSSKENTVEKKPDYIHVRARRGQATDSHSLAERVRRERISERMKYLQGLVPGCNKITGKAGMLDEIINYVQSLQRQVEFLSMKLAAMNPRLEDFNMESLLFTKEMNFPCTSNISTVGMSPPETVDPTFLQLHSLQQAMTSSRFDMDASVTLQRTISMPAPATTSEQFLDSFINVQRTNVGWDNDLNNLYGSAFPFQGTFLSNLKTEM